MTTNKKKIAWVATGFATIAANSLSPALISPASAANVPLPTCDATQTDSAIDATLATYNTAAINTYKGGAKYKQLVAAVKNAQKALKGKKGKAKTTAQKNLDKAIAKRNKALADATTAATVTQFAATVTGTPVLETTRENAMMTWGDYTTRIFVKGGKAVDLCYAIDESDHSAEDQAISQNDYISLWPLDDIATELVPGNSAKTAVQINTSFEDQVNTYIQSFGEDFADWTWDTQLGAMTSATYTVKTFYDSIQAALIEAELITE
ncbi:MAG: hypothetical protein RLZZ330_451 [Actinomycetota bacterium]|jgi:hypothetical protein